MKNKVGEVYKNCHEKHYKRDVNWQEANWLVNQDLPVSLDYYDDLEYLYQKRKEVIEKLRILSVLYIKNKESKNIILIGENEKGESVILVIPYVHRFTKEYKKRLWKKFKKYMEPLKNSRYMFFITLTISFREFTSIGAGAKYVQRKFNSLMTVLREYGIYYVAIKEIQEKNTKNVHIHLLIKNDKNENGKIKKIFMLEEIKSIIGENWDYFFDVKEIEPEKKENGRPEKNFIVEYLGKYLKKSMLASDGEVESDTMIILWALNMRVISCSRRKPEERVSSEKKDLITENKTNSNSLSDTIVWEYVGVFSYFQVPLQEGIYREDDIHPSILDVINKFLNNKSRLKKIF